MLLVTDELVATGVGIDFFLSAFKDVRKQELAVQLGSGSVHLETCQSTT